jgi:hypothetical protein
MLRCFCAGWFRGTFSVRTGDNVSIHAVEEISGSTSSDADVREPMGAALRRCR